MATNFRSPTHTPEETRTTIIDDRRPRNSRLAYLLRAGAGMALGNACATHGQQRHHLARGDEQNLDVMKSALSVPGVPDDIRPDFLFMRTLIDTLKGLEATSAQQPPSN